ncbi:unnamed protein product [Dracunculus medinensis]|uniref:ShKT domain-containing protein n=1 Tax=Dracunculus medinensis TaxID=318479 RepID=A0A158Q472_DRAME|nr:unnamed protein product [Dracunculus medinensis]
MFNIIFFIILHVSKIDATTTFPLQLCDKEIGSIVRPSVPVTACEDVNKTVCEEIFHIPPSVLKSNLDETQDYEVNEKCYLRGLIHFAESNFETTDFCQNLLKSNSCTTPDKIAIAIAKCPQTCALCDRKGAGGKCRNILPDRLCESSDAVLGCHDSLFLQKNCMGTCELTTCLEGEGAKFPAEMTTTPSGPCEDTRINCNDYFNVCHTYPFLPIMKIQCRLTCDGYASNVHCMMVLSSNIYWQTGLFGDKGRYIDSWIHERCGPMKKAVIYTES